MTLWDLHCFTNVMLLAEQCGVIVIIEISRGK